MLVAANKQLYITLPKRQKMLLSRSIVNAVRSQNPPGRFLQKNGKTKLWNDVGDQRAQEKTSQALREGAPDIRKKVAAAITASTSGDSNSGFMNETVTSAQIPVPPSAPQHQQTDATDPSKSLPSNGRMTARESQQLYQHQQQQHALDNSNNNMYGRNGMSSGGHGHMNLNERGRMVQNAVMMANNGMNVNGQHCEQSNNNIQNFQIHQHPYQQQQPSYNRYQQHQHQNLHHQEQYQPQNQQQQLAYYNKQNKQQESNNTTTVPTPTVDELSAATPVELETNGLSFGSIAMTDDEMHLLQQAATISRNNPADQQYSIENMSKNGRHNQRHLVSREYENNNIDSNVNKNNDIINSRSAVPAAPTGETLEPTGTSIGDISMMSGGTNFSNFQMKLDPNAGGTSFGTIMSYNMLNNSDPNMVDGGLMDVVGTSFGSMSLDKNSRDNLFRTLEIAGGGREVPPMFRNETKAFGNLLDCSDTESESSRDKDQLTKQKSQAWEIMKTTLEKQTSKDLMPPPLGRAPHENNAPQPSSVTSGNPHPVFDNVEIALPTTTMEPNLSTLSAWSAAEDDDSAAVVAKNQNALSTNREDDEEGDAAATPAPPPPQLTKTDSF
ncbi:unnamed protein product [Pseudo-nitzschia multistriata]|uniref:DUF6824 domain-containing protein n=1 Tax=Pseudo-nitzschia multistriata TaxID=183589 RepID=A0A448ZM87_9STRA|nr:unnamed protein product [Pseudo-nitzschia multistriata]